MTTECKTPDEVWEQIIKVAPPTTGGVLAEEAQLMSKADFLDRVKSIVAEREGQHGKPAETFKAIAAAWSAYLTAIVGVPVMLREEDVAMMMVELKVQRFAGGQGTHMDTLLDIAGYAACAGELASRGV
mgnify:FL=1